MDRNGSARLPGIDDRLVMPGTRYEIVEGQVVYVSPALEPHAECHAKLISLLMAHAARGYRIACDMLTRTSALNDFAPDASVYRAERDPETGGRRLEELSFEVVSEQSLSLSGKKARALTARGVRRVFAIDVKRERVLEWSRDTDGWELLAVDAAIDDPALIRPLAIRELVSPGPGHEAVAAALLAHRTETMERERAQGSAAQVAMLIEVLKRGAGVSEAEHAAIAAIDDPVRLHALFLRALDGASASEVLADD